jgi:hypothetical protein
MCKKYYDIPRLCHGIQIPWYLNTLVFKYLNTLLPNRPYT